MATDRMILHALAGRDRARHFSPHVWKAEMALVHKGLTFEIAAVPFTGIPAVEGGSKTVPVLRDGDTLVRDSFEIAQHLERAYPDRPSLFGGPGGEALARFVERWSQTQLHPYLGSASIMDIHDRLDPVDLDYFRTSREARYGQPIEQVAAQREARLAAFRERLEPLRAMLAYQPFLGGDGPLFADYIVFSAFQWVRLMSPFEVLAADDPVAAWRDRCLDLHGGHARRLPAAA